MEANLLDKMLAHYHDERMPVTVVLQNRTRISGTVKAFDSYVILLDAQRSEIIYRHAISSILPAAAAAQPRAVQKKNESRQPPQRTENPAARTGAARQKPHKAASRTPNQAENSGINTGMKEGLLRWMQEQKPGK
jgi:host factor-I protein